MRRYKKVLSMLLAAATVFAFLPTAALASDGGAAADSGTAYISVSFDGEFIADKNGEATAYMPVSIDGLSAVDLSEYGLSDFAYDADGDGNNDITALHLYIYTHEELMGGDWSDVTVSGGPGSIFFESGLFGIEGCNFNYYYNGAYPEVDGWGVTSDQLTLSDGDYLDVAGYSSWSFFSDPASGFRYFADYYERIVETVEEKASSVSLANGALHRSKSSDNSRLIVALSSIGKTATDVGGWNLITPYDDFDWIKNQGINGPVWALIALDSNGYATGDSTVRQQCVDYILEKQLSDGGWSLSGTTANADITGMVLQALYPYRNQTDVANAAKDGFDCLSAAQLANGGFSSDGSETAESAAQVITACSVWGIDAHTNESFIKNDKSAVDALLAFYLSDEAAFKHQSGGESNDIATAGLLGTDSLQQIRKRSELALQHERRGV